MSQGNSAARPADEVQPVRALWWRHPTLTIGGGLLALMVMMAVFAPLIAPYDPLTINPRQRLLPSSAEHLFGTDGVGRDLFSRVVWGARISLMVGFAVAIVASLAGLLIGLLSGTVRWLDPVIMRITDATMSIPPILLAIALMALWRGSLGAVILAVSLAETPRMARLVRSTVLSLREQPYIEAARASGASLGRVMFLHILPNTLPPLMVQASYVCASAMIVESILSFVGAGISPTIPTWGNIMAEGRSLWLIQPMAIFYPAIFLSLTVLAVNLLGDALRDILDPRAAS